MSEMTYLRRRNRIAVLAAVAALLVPVGSARAAGGAELSVIAGAYAAHGGTIPACEFTSAQLNAALSEAGGDIQQYSADLLAAIQQALSARASGACGGSHATVAPPVATTTGAAPPALPQVSTSTVIAPPPSPPGGGRSSIAPTRIVAPSVSAASHSGLPAPLWILAIAGLVLTLAAVVAGSFWLTGFSPAFLAAGRHSFAEAGYRLSGAWTGFADWAAAHRRAAGDEIPGR